MEVSEDMSVQEQIFYKRVREFIICTLLFICLYIVSHLVIGYYKKTSEFITDNIEDAAVNKIVLWLCTFSLSISVGAVLLLPMSILSNELLLGFTQSSYTQWLNGSLLYGFWNLVFLFSNLCLVFILPFAYFFSESEGLPGSRKGVKARVFETGVVLLLLALLMMGLVWVASAFLHNNVARGGLCELWKYYLPHFYSSVSLSGLLLLLLCTPFGLSQMFSITRRLLVKPRMRVSNLLEDIEETMGCIVLEEASLVRKLTSETFCLNINAEILRYEYLSTQMYRTTLEMQRTAPIYNLVYPLAMLLLLALTVMCVLIVCFHVLVLLFDETAMPRWVEDPLLGTASFSMFGVLGAVIQVILILYTYLMTSSVVGFYSSPLFTGLQPRMQDTTIIQIIGNCVSLLVLSSALPAFSRTLGITRFDLVGDFGRYNWLANFHVVFLYNLMFVGLTSASLIETVTWTLQRDLAWAFGLHKPSLTVSHSTIPLRILLANGISKIK